MSDIKKQVLGRGLSALFAASTEDTQENNRSSSFFLSIEAIRPGAYQPRHHFPEENLMALTSSILEKGVLQPILVRLHPQEKDKYEIIAGERRWRAAKQAGLSTIPALIREFTDGEALEVGLLENIQRQDLNPIEEAMAYHRLAEEFHHTQDSLSRILGKSRSHIANILRLLTLPKKVKDYLIEGKLSLGHGRALIGAENAEELAELIIEKNLNVRQTETLTKQGLPQERRSSPVLSPDPEKDILCTHLSDLLGKPVDLVMKGNAGKVVISFKNPAELDEILNKLNALSSLSKPQSPPVRVWSVG